MRRREFVIGLFAISLGKPTLARERSRIIILHSGFPNRTPIHLLLEALGKFGYENSSTATIDLLGGEGDPNRLNALVTQVGAQMPDVIIAITSPCRSGIGRCSNNRIFRGIEKPHPHWTNGR